MNRKEHIDVVLPITCNNNHLLTTFYFSSNLDAIKSWTVTLYGDDNSIDIKVYFVARENCGCAIRNSNLFIEFRNTTNIYIAPHQGKKPIFFKDTEKQLWEWYFLKAKISRKDVLMDGQLCFDIVITTRPETEVVDQPSSTSSTLSISKYQKIMLTLLKDVNSVDLCFVFKTDKTCSNVALWAHSSILSRYPTFDSIIQEAIGLNSLFLHSDDEKGNDTSPNSHLTAREYGDVLVQPVSETSMATMCSLLLYIYTDEINLSIDTKRHAISRTESTLTVVDMMGQGKRSMAWHPLDSDSQYKFKDVTWAELLIAAEKYGVTDLQSHCEKKVIATIKNSNAIEVLFNLGTRFKTIKTAALGHIVGNMTVLFSEGRDPFAPYVHHPDCHTLLIEVLQNKAKKG
ncbi:hypothetical protein BX616_003284 [Lobosporangium transversale]|uniref:BTB domain-containing protein n=1 Tax=Lobosporangium transversale TaxID=64571 RepID=A0A1Y2GIZ2_9FUNG|nr:hypothetical protein BCR41DRAFT_388523 [Lobosporangium transversale]KAF9899099.1 hypothetical protein BX616_003284 [Lobosporangium transversale]ORZ08807.1 hypothetical protein BCR41DRAFT_388523 [Lobosporangium transversale]|eukprot:XP_021878590.1 hypothetical protein BCR41DRAFT_388523 [Lobosporangium transversale]